MPIRFTDEDGREFEFRGEYRQHFIYGDYYLAEDGKVLMCIQKTDYALRAIVHLIPKPPVYHDFGGIRFEETEKVRQVEFGEWYSYMHTVMLHSFDSKTIFEHSILKPVAIIDQEK